MGRLYRNLYFIFKLIKRRKTLGIILKKIWIFVKGITYFQVIFMLFWTKWKLVCCNLPRNGTENGFYNIKDTFAENFNLQLSVLHQSICIFKAGLSGLSDDKAKYKGKIPDMSDFNQNVETTCNSKLNFVELKDLFIKRVQKI